MADSVPVGEAKTKLSELIRRVEAGEEIVIRRGATPVARLVPELPRPIRKPGAFAGQLWISDDFDAPLEEFEEYM